MPEPLRIAFLGCGFITGVHSRALQSLRGVIECGYASRDRAKADECCRRYSGVASFGNYTSAIGDPRVNAVVVAVPPRFHLERAIDDQRLMDQIYATLGTPGEGCTIPDQDAGRIGQ